MARALIVACGCRGRELGRRLLAGGWMVRGTTRFERGLSPIEEAGIEAVIADPDRAATVLDQIADVTVVYWLLGSARAVPEALAAIHGPRLERVLEMLVDSPVRGFVYEAAGDVQRQHLEAGTGVVRAAASRWRIPVACLGHDPTDWRGWVEEATGAARRLAEGG